MAMNSDNWLSEVTKGKAATAEATSLDRRREFPEIIRQMVDQARITGNPVVFMLTPTAATRLADDLDVALKAYPDGPPALDLMPIAKPQS